MGEWLDEADFVGCDVQDVRETISELEVHLSLHYPTISDGLTDARRRSLRALLTPIVRRWMDIGTGVEGTSVTGPFTDTVKAGLHVLQPHEQAALAAFCAAAPSGAVPRGSFPPVEPIGDLFVRRPGWS